MKWKQSIAIAALLAVAFAPLAIAQGEAAPEEMTGVKVGEKVPDFSLTDQNGETHTLESLLAEDGTLVLMFHRSANW